MKTTSHGKGPPPRVYDPTWPDDEPYRPNLRKSGNHFGQRKLLMAEIEFLTLHGHRAQEVLYIGAAPGLHIRALADCFPLHRFVLFDPCPFHARLRDTHWAGSARVELRQELFTDAHAEALRARGHPLLFLSDVRHKEAHDVYPSEESVSRDMAAQRRWVEILQPAAAMLKFRLPWCGPEGDDGVDPIEYLEGELRLPVWGCPSTTETRLVALPPYTSRAWDPRVYERHMFHFNLRVRSDLFEGRTYDEAAEHAILSEYVATCAPSQKPNTVRQRVLRELCSAPPGGGGAAGKRHLHPR